MIKSYEPSLIGIPFLKECVNHFSSKNLKLTSNISFNLAFLLCSRFCRITRNAISAFMLLFSLENVQNEMRDLFLVNLTPLSV